MGIKSICFSQNFKIIGFLKKTTNLSHLENWSRIVGRFNIQYIRELGTLFLGSNISWLVTSESYLGNYIINLHLQGIERAGVMHTATKVAFTRFISLCQP